MKTTLLPSATYVVRAEDASGTRELTRFTTAAGYDKAPGTAPIINQLRLWRIRYPVSAIAAGGCVFDEFEGYVQLDYQDGSIPSTPPEQVVSVVTLRPKNGASQETYVFTGANPFGRALDFEDTSNLPAAQSTWKPLLDPTREYCATLSIVGRNDQAITPVMSNTLCVPVILVDRTMPAGSGSDGGVDSSVIPTTDAKSMVPSNSTGGGCSLAPHGRPAIGWFALAGIGAALISAGRRRRARAVSAD